MTQTTQTTTDRPNSEQGARYGTTNNVAADADEIVIEVDESQAKDESEPDSEPIQRGPEQAVLSGGDGGDGDHADKRAATFERHANGFHHQSHTWGSTFEPSDADDRSRYSKLKRVQNVGDDEHGDTGGRHTNEDAKIFRRFRSISQGLELPNSIQQRAGRILQDIREIPRQVCHAWGSELTIAACIIEASEEVGYKLSFDDVYQHLPQHPDRERDQAQHRFEMAREEVQDRHRHRNASHDDPVVANIRIVGDRLNLADLTVETAESLYDTFGDKPTEREEAHGYGKNPPALAGGYVHAVVQKLPDQDQPYVPASDIGEVLNLSPSAVSATSKAIRESVNVDALSGCLPAFAGVDVYEYGGATATKELINELQRLAEKLEKTPTQKEMDDHGEYSAETYRNRFGSWNEVVKTAGLEPNKEGYIPDDELLNELQRLTEKLEKTPTQKEMDDHGKYSAETYRNRFGSWSEAKEKAGF